MDMNDFKTEADLTIDEWIDLFKYKIETADTKKQASEYSNALNFFRDIKVKLDKASNATITDNMLIYVKMVCDTFNAAFKTWECKTIKEGAYIILTNDVIYIKISDIDNIECLLSFNVGANPILVAEITIMLNDIFGSFLHINDDMFMINPINKNYIWGEQEIQRCLQQSQPRKLNPMIYFSNEGNA